MHRCLHGYVPQAENLLLSEKKKKAKENDSNACRHLVIKIIKENCMNHFTDADKVVHNKHHKWNN